MRSVGCSFKESKWTGEFPWPAEDTKPFARTPAGVVELADYFGCLEQVSRGWVADPMYLGTPM